MCYICKCCGWALDFVQRVLTFALSCILFMSICIGISVAIAAGIAYGYNYMLAEFLTLGRTDVAVYVRRGQFNDKPNFGKSLRRKGDEDDLFSSNSSDYQDTKVQGDTKPLSDTWRKALDTRKYAQKLTKYGLAGPDNFFNSSAVVVTSTEKAFFTSFLETTETVVLRRVYSITPNPRMPTTLHPVRTDIVMRNFAPVDKMPTTNALNLNDDFYQDHGHSAKHRKEKQSEANMNLKENKYKSYIPPKRFNKIKPTFEYSDEIDEDNIVYRPV